MVEPAGVQSPGEGQQAFPAAGRLAALLGWSPDRVEPLGGGRNSQVFKLAHGDQRAVLKRYFRHPGDPRDRLATEWTALTFCREQGLEAVPGTLAADPEGGFALYEFIQGEPVPAPSGSEVDQAAAFLVALRALAGRPAAAELPPASEACFSFRALEGNLRTRLATLRRPAETHPDLRAFLEQDLAPVGEELLAECRDACRRSGLPFDQELPVAARTLSPSDFGFQNALRRDGRLVFLDFEYFGWDDPAKTLCDLLLHPGMALSAEHRARLAQGLLAGMADRPELPLRARLAFPLYGIKWCLILLNEFLRGPLERRAFARPGEAPEALQARQLLKAQDKLKQLLDDHGHFPYFPT